MSMVSAAAKVPFQKISSMAPSSGCHILRDLVHQSVSKKKKVGSRKSKYYVVQEFKGTTDIKPSKKRPV